jgi:hypothetical protein
MKTFSRRSQVVQVAPHGVRALMAVSARLPIRLPSPSPTALLPLQSSSELRSGGHGE